jgi:zinc D-Ala-D-Ala carboxypeptidase
MMLAACANVGAVSAIYGTKIKPADYLIGKFNPANDTSLFRTVPGSPDKYIRKDVYAQLEKLIAAFKKAHAGIPAPVVSATRNYQAQKAIWNGKWDKDTRYRLIKDPKKKAQGILEYSAMPGSSRHHWGTDIDLLSVAPAFFNSGNGKTFYAWMQSNAATFGFCQPYTKYESKVSLS